MNTVKFAMLGLVLLITSIISVNAQTYTPDILELTGTNGIEVFADPRLQLGDGGTIEFWVEPDWRNVPDYDPVILSNAGLEGVSYLIAILRDRDGLAIVSGDDEEIISFDFSDNQMHHVAINNYTNNIIVFIDDEVVGNFDMTIKDRPSLGLWIGTADGQTAPFKGALGALRLWGIPVEQEMLREFSLKPALSDVTGDHPDIDYLMGMSDFDNEDFLLIDSVELIDP